MEKKLNALIEENYTYTSPRLLFPEEGISFQVPEDETCQGTFIMHTEDGSEVRGFLGCASPRMQVSPESFAGPSVEVRWHYSAAGKREGEPERGRLIVTSSIGEYEIPFFAEPRRHSFQSSIGEIRTLHDFANLARLNREEALKIFRNRFFLTLFSDAKLNLCCRGLCYRGASSAEMEEFLIAGGAKARARIRPEPRMLDLGTVKSICVASIRLHASEWGIPELKIHTDAAFLQLKQETLREEDFVDGQAEIACMVLPEKMHEGINPGEIRIISSLETIQIPVSAKRAKQKMDPEEESAHYRARAAYLLEHYYMEYHLKGGELQDWAKDTADILDRLIERYPDDTWYVLFKCHVLIAAGNRIDASWLLKETAAKCRRRYSPLWCYAHYLENFLNQEGENTRIQQEIRETRKKYPRHPLLMRLENEMLLQEADQNPKLLETYYKNLKKTIESTSACPALFLDAFRVIREQTALADAMDETDIRIFCWAAGRGLLTKKTASHVVSRAGKVRTFHVHFYRLLECCYEVTKSDVCVRAVCTYLIKNNRCEPEYLIWFERGLEKRMRITGLCEAYIQARQTEEGEIPWKVLQYFSKRTLLPSVYRARIYAYAVQNRDRIGKDWHAYERLIGDFLIEELQKDHMSDDLAVLYLYVREYDETRSKSPVMRAAADCCKVVCENHSFSHLVVCTEENERGTRIPLQQGTAFPVIGREPYEILFEDSRGRRYSMEGAYTIRRMFPPLQKDAQGGELPDGPAAEAAAANKLPAADPANPDTLLTYACSIEELAAQTEESARKGLDVSLVQKQLLMRMLFTGHFTENHADYFQAVCRMSGTETLRDAYAAFFSGRYIYEDEEAPEEMFDYLAYWSGRGRTVNSCCGTALLKYYCVNGWQDPEQEAYVRVHLERALAEGVRYPFFENLPMSWRRRYLLLDEHYVHVPYLPGKQMQCELISESRGERARAEFTMREVLPGFYVLPVRLFLGETLEYMAYEMADGVVKTGTLRLPVREILTSPDSGYRALNEALEEAAESADQLKSYAQKLDMTRILFRPIKENPRNGN